MYIKPKNGPRSTNIMMFMGKPVIVSDNAEKLKKNVLAEVGRRGDFEWSATGKLFCVDPATGQQSFTGHELRRVARG